MEFFPSLSAPAFFAMPMSVAAESNAAEFPCRSVRGANDVDRDEIETDLLMRLERAVVSTVQKNVEDEDLATHLIVELMASMEGVIRRPEGLLPDLSSPAA